MHPWCRPPLGTGRPFRWEREARRVAGRREAHTQYEEGRAAGEWTIAEEPLLRGGAGSPGARALQPTRAAAIRFAARPLAQLAPESDFRDILVERGFSEADVAAAVAERGRLLVGAPAATAPSPAVP